MKYTKENVTELLNNIQTLNELANEFITATNKGSRYSYAKINCEQHVIEQEVNTACNCHPEYEWQACGTIEELVEWINNNKKEIE